MSTNTGQLSTALAGRYAVIRELGQGGMATVYLAEDLKHDRKVALKVLKPELAAVLGAERFVVEIKTTAALQHPHILPLFDSGEAGGFLYYVMPFIDGETLRTRLSRETQLGVSEAVRIAIALLDALDYAHRHGVVHRDIKPENILLHEGQPMVADFGIALAVSAAAGGRMTETGLSLGTPHYMSPEQATAEKEITGRSDIYSLASVLYEMLTGNPPHTGSSAQQIIMKIITESAQPVTAHRKSVPPHVAAAVAQALEKLPADRFESAKAFADALGDPGFTLATHARTQVGAGAPMTPQRRAMAMAPWVMLVIVTGLLASTPLRHRDAPAPPVARFSFGPKAHGLVVDASGSPIAVSPDGSRIVYAGRDSGGARHLFLRALDRDEPVLIAGTADAYAPFISPDGDHLGFMQDGRIRRISFGGGTSVTVAEANSNSMTWGPDGLIYFTTAEGLFRVSSSGGAPELFVPLDTALFQALRWPDATPDGRSVLITVVQESAPQLAVVSLPDGRVEMLGVPGMYPRLVEGDHLAFLQSDGTLFGVDFDSRRRRVIGAPVPIANDVRYGPAYPGKLGVSRSGTIAYLTGQATMRELVIVDRNGSQTLLSAPSRFYQTPRFSPDGSRLAVLISDFSARAKSDLWTFDMRTGNLGRVTFDSSSGVPAWSADGRFLYYNSGASVMRIPVDGSGIADTVLTRGGALIAEIDVSRDGRWIVWQEVALSNSNRDLYLTTVDTPRTVRPLVRTPFNEYHPSISPDGEWLAYGSVETGRGEVFVRRLAEGSGRWMVSNGGGHSPRWGGRRELFFRNGDSVLVTTISDAGDPPFTPPRAIVGGQFSGGGAPQNDVSADGRRLAFVRSGRDLDAPMMHVVMNWFANLQSKGNGRGR